MNKKENLRQLNEKIREQNKSTYLQSKRVKDKKQEDQIEQKQDKDANYDFDYLMNRLNHNLETKVQLAESADLFLDGKNIDIKDQLLQKYEDITKRVDQYDEKFSKIYDKSTS